VSPVRELPPSAEKEILYMKTATPKENTQTNYTQLPIDKIVALKRITKVPVKRRRITREMILEDAFTYQIPMEVTQIMKRLNGDCYPVCPRCRITIEREYMSFCDRCGQRLGWKKLKDAVIVLPGHNLAAKKEKSVTFLYFKYIYPVKRVRGQGLGKDGFRKTHTRGAEQERIHTAGAGK
jgi:hypothetical protein